MADLPLTRTLAIERLVRVRLEGVKAAVFVVLCFGRNPRPHPHIALRLGRN